jgi:hypothetical protein
MVVGTTLKWHKFLGLQCENLENFKLWITLLYWLITFKHEFWFARFHKKNYSSWQDICKVVFHALSKVIWPFLLNVLVVRIWNVNLILNFSFGHNLWFRFSNGECHPILIIYYLRPFQHLKRHLMWTRVGPQKIVPKIKNIARFQLWTRELIGEWCKVHFLTLVKVFLNPRTLFSFTSFAMS